MMDADTREDFDRLEAYENGRHVPDRETCERLLAWFRTPTETVRHCRAVAALAEEIGRAANARGAGLSLERIRAGGAAARCGEGVAGPCARGRAVPLSSGP